MWIWNSCRASWRQPLPCAICTRSASTAELSCLLIIYHQSAREEVLGVLRGFNTSRPDFSSLSGNPAENISALKGQVEAGGKEIDRLTEQLKVMAKNANLLKTGSDMGRDADRRPRTFVRTSSRPRASLL